jgi:hypothetical protein
MTHRLMLRGEAGRWLIEDVLAPTAAGLAVAGLGWLLLSRLSAPPILVVAGALLTLAASWMAAALAAGRVRRWVFPPRVGGSGASPHQIP